MLNFPHMQNKKYNLGVIFIFILIIIPVVLWFLAPSYVPRFDSFLGSLVSVGQLLGIVGFMLFAINIILSARMHWLENIFYGLNKVYIYHARIGKSAFYLMLFHPLTLFFGYNGFTTAGLLSFFTPTKANIALSSGIIGFFLMIVLVILTIYFAPRRHIKYNIWKWTHKFMGVVLFLGAIHAFLMPSDVSSFAPLKFYILGIFILSSLAYLYHSVLGRFLKKKYQYIVSNVNVLGGNVTEVTLKPFTQKHKMVFTPGQFAFISFVDKNVSSESHPFSLTSSTTDETISFNMKSLGDYTSTLPNLQVGAKAFIEGPFGKFSYKDSQNKKQIWIAGGIGVTPFLSMIQSVKDEPEYFVEFYYCLRNETEAVHLEELKSFENSNIKIITHYSDTAGFINADIVKNKSTGLLDKEIFICAPPMMIHSLRKQLISLGVKNTNIHSEEFKLF